MSQEVLRYYCETCRTRSRGPNDEGRRDPWRSEPGPTMRCVPCPTCEGAMLDLASEEAWSYLQEVQRGIAERRERWLVGVCALTYAVPGCLFMGMGGSQDGEVPVTAAVVMLVLGLVATVIVVIVTHKIWPNDPVLATVDEKERAALRALAQL